MRTRGPLRSTALNSNAKRSAPAVGDNARSADYNRDRMGAWGHKTFENDSALDWLGDLADEDASLIGDALDAIVGADEGTYIEVDQATAALAAAEFVASASGKGDDRLTHDAAAWLFDNRDAVRQIGAARAQRAVARVYESSELRELWDESGDDTAWHADVRELLRRLSP